MIKDAQHENSFNIHDAILRMSIHDPKFLTPNYKRKKRLSTKQKVFVYTTSILILTLLYKALRST